MAKDTRSRWDLSVALMREPVQGHRSHQGLTDTSSSRHTPTPTRFGGCSGSGAADWGFATRAIHTGQEPDPATGATIVPIYATSTYTQAAPGQHKGYEYSRSGNPTSTALESCLAALEGGERGLAFASGLAASTAVLLTLRPGDEVVAAADLYGGTFRLLERVFRQWGLVAR